ncbi:hypothetical protein T08_2791 [Trichinella sp. T8]|nr:hypothetical protein T08_2791 [Trichinella sp. T8]
MDSDFAARITNPSPTPIHCTHALYIQLIGEVTDHAS